MEVGQGPNWGCRTKKKILVCDDHVIWAPFHDGMARTQVAGEEHGLQIWKIAVNILGKQSRAVGKGWSSSLEVGREAHILLTIKLHLLRSVTQVLELGRILWINDQS
jgi:hypothetical protein